MPHKAQLTVVGVELYFGDLCVSYHIWFILSPLIFVSFSRLENSETKSRNETKLSGDSMYILYLTHMKERAAVDGVRGVGD